MSPSGRVRIDEHTAGDEDPEKSRPMDVPPANLNRATTMRILLFAVYSLVFATVAAQEQEPGPLVHEGIVNAPIDKVWEAWTTDAGLRSWLAPHAEIDFRISGKMRANYRLDGSLDDPGTIENTVLSYDPYRMISMKVSKAPDDFPFQDAIYEMWTVIYFEPVDAQQTRISVIANGFASNEESQAMRAFFERGNALTIRQMQERIPSAAQ